MITDCTQGTNKKQYELTNRKSPEDQYKLLDLGKKQVRMKALFCGKGSNKGRNQMECLKRDEKEDDEK